MFRARGKGPSLRQVSGNVFSDKIPGGNLILGVLDRQLMTWSDRGGASKYFGDCWSDLVTQNLTKQVGWTRSLAHGETFRLDAVVRLDDDSRIAIQAGRHKLTNPDFVLFGRKQDGSAVLQAADSKFSVDTIKPAQVSAEALQALLDVEHGLVRATLEQSIHDHDVIAASVERGLFLSPVSPLTDFFLPRVLSDASSDVERSHVELIEANPAELFGSLDETKLIGTLARVDHLPVSPRDHLLSAMYYLRVACACSWMWVEQRTPLLSRQDPPAVDLQALAEETGQRAAEAESAYDVISTWFETVEDVSRNRKSLNEVMSLPLRMSEIRTFVEAAGVAEDRRVVRSVRAALDRAYRDRLLDEVGEIDAVPSEPLPEVLQRVAAASRSLRTEMHQLAVSLIDEQVARLGNGSAPTAGSEFFERDVSRQLEGAGRGTVIRRTATGIAPCMRRWVDGPSRRTSVRATWVTGFATS